MKVGGPSMPGTPLSGAAPGGRRASRAVLLQVSGVLVLLVSVVFALLALAAPEGRLLFWLPFLAAAAGLVIVVLLVGPKERNDRGRMPPP